MVDVIPMLAARRRIKTRPADELLWKWDPNLEHWVGNCLGHKCFVWCEHTGQGPEWDGVSMGAKGGPEPSANSSDITRWICENTVNAKEEQ